MGTTTSALIGCTGFVGGALQRQTQFDAMFHSVDIEQIAGRRFDVIVCAGAPAQKWKANQDPDADWRNIERLLDALRRVDTRRMILISTVDVYGRPLGVTEAAPPEGATPYGEHRHRLEQVLAARFPTLIVRLPGLFGAGLKKNAIYDLLHANQVDNIDGRARYQFYDIDRLWADIQTANRAGLSLVHLATEPVAMQDVAAECFGIDLQAKPQAAPAAYDLRTMHAELYGGRNGYILDRTQVLQGITRFVEDQCGRRQCR